MPQQTAIQELLEAGVHFGHQARRWNPKMGRYILAKRQNIHVVDLRQTARCLDAALEAVRQVAERGGKILFVGTKKQAQEIVAEQAGRCNQFYVNRRWLGGQLTNFKTIKGRIGKLKELDTAKEDGTFERFSKKEALSMEREREKLERSLGGIKELPHLPDLMYVIDPRRERIAVAEANHLNIPVVAITDTNCDPDVIDYPIPGNDDATRAIRLITARIADAVLEGRASGAVATEVAAAQAPKTPEAPEARAEAEAPKAEAKTPAAPKAEAKTPAAPEAAEAPAEPEAAGTSETAEAAEPAEAAPTEPAEEAAEAPASGKGEASTKG
jgi:small subunit ribosomal protein S2